MTQFPNCKINLGLNIVGKRAGMDQIKQRLSKAGKGAE